MRVVPGPTNTGLLTVPGSMEVDRERTLRVVEEESSTHTAPFLHRVLAALAPDLAARLSPSRVQELDFLVRKTFHVLSYVALAVAFLQWDALGGYNSFVRSKCWMSGPYEAVRGLWGRAG